METTELNINEFEELFNDNVSTSEEPIQEDSAPIIQPNPKSLLVKENTSRFSSASWFNEVQQKSVLLAGLGGIGSWTALLLSRLNIDCITLMDSDIVDASNMSGQLYGTNHMGDFKVDSIVSLLNSLSGYFSTVGLRERFTLTSTAYNIMIGGFDNMAARRTFYEAWVEHIARLSIQDRKQCLFIDGRLAAEEFQIYCFTGVDTYHINKYGTEYLFSDFEAEEEVCSYKQTSYSACMIASFIVNLFVNFNANLCNDIKRDLPFITRYDASRVFLKTENI